MSANHHIRVVVLVDADEYLNLRSMSEEDGLSASAYMRRLLKLKARERALEKLSELQAFEDSAEVAQKLCNQSGPL